MLRFRSFGTLNSCLRSRLRTNYSSTFDSFARNNFTKSFSTSGSTATTTPPITKNSVDPHNVLPSLAKAEKIVGKRVTSPKFVLISMQSGGKSSTSGAITGMDILYTDVSMATRRPLIQILNRTNHETFVEFEDGEKMFNLEKAKKRLYDENNAVDGVADDPIHITIHSPNVQNCTIIDLPGLKNAVKDKKTKDMPKRISDMCEKYIRDPHSIPLLLIPATDDPETNAGLAFVQENNAEGRTFGIVTKMDLAKDFSGVMRLLSNQDFQLGFGYVGVALRSKKDIDAGVTLSQMEENEEVFFKNSGLDKNEDVKLGVNTLRNELSRIQLMNTIVHLPIIIDQLNACIKDMQEDKNFLIELSQEKDKDVVAKDLEILVKKLHPASNFRITFELELRKNMREAIHTKLKMSFDKRFSENLSKSGIVDTKTNQLNLYNTLGTSFDINENYDLDRFKRMFIFGENCPDKIDDKTSAKIMTDFLKSRLLLKYFGITFPDDMNQSRGQWVDRLQSSIHDTLEKREIISSGNKTDKKENIESEIVTLRTVKYDDDLPKIIFDLTMIQLNHFVDNVQMQKDTSRTRLARKFAKYLLEQIGTEIYSVMETALKCTINKEQRPLPQLGDIIYDVAKKIKHPENHKGIFRNLLLNGTIPVKTVTIYKKEFTEAYFENLADKLTDELFRECAVDFLDPIIFKCIQKTLTMFSENKLMFETKKHNEKLAELESVRNTLQSAYDVYKLDLTK